MDQISKMQILAGLKQVILEELGGDSIHILNDTNAVISTRDVDGFPYRCLKLTLNQELSAGDIDKFIAELKTFKEKLEKLNQPPQHQ